MNCPVWPTFASTWCFLEAIRCGGCRRCLFYLLHSLSYRFLLLYFLYFQYPAENEYKRYLRHHAGASNASTLTDHTVFHFGVHHGALEGALDRFSQFFTAPLFTESCTDREVHAVDSEHQKNLQNDGRRMFMVRVGCLLDMCWHVFVDL